MVASTLVATMRCAVCKMRVPQARSEYPDYPQGRPELRMLTSRLNATTQVVGLVPLCGSHTNPEMIAMDDYVTRKYIST